MYNIISTFIILVLSNITNDNDQPSTSTDAEPSHSQATSSQAAKAAAELDKEKAQREHHRTKFNDWLENGYNKDLADKNEARKKKNGKENTEKSHSTRSIIDKTKYNKILDYLLGNIALGHPEYDTQFSISFSI